MVYNPQRRGAQYGLIAGDLLLAIVVLLLVTSIRYGSAWSGDTLRLHLLAFIPIIAVNIISHYAFGLYDSLRRLTNTQLLATILRSQLITTVIGALFFYFIPSSIIALEPRRVLLGYTLVMVPLAWIWHTLSRRLLHRVLPALKVLVLGRGARAERLVAELRRAPYLGYEAIELDPTTHGELDRAIETDQPSAIVNALERPSPEILAALQRCLYENRPVIGLAPFTEQVLQKVPVEDIDQLWLIENFSARRRLIYETGKRFFDVLLAALGLTISLPLIPFIAAAVKATPGPVLFKQIRTGVRGKPFLAIKFRTMVAEAEKNGPQWSSANDPRVTKSGRFLRATRLDEIPQLLNVLAGDMSLVGPRPERPEFVAALVQQIPFYRERLLVKPGLTGWAQINYPYGDSVEDALEKLRYDLYYIKNRSLLLDLSTVLKTVNTVLRGLGR